MIDELRQLQIFLSGFLPSFHYADISIYFQRHVIILAEL
jgi:hypothetical protein